MAGGLTDIAGQHFGRRTKIGSVKAVAGGINSKKAVIMTVEVSFAALILFGILLLIATISSMQKDYPKDNELLKNYPIDMLASLQKQGAFEQIFKHHNDKILRNSLDALPPSLCAQIEIYSNSLSENSLNYSYTSQNCTTLQNIPKALAYRSEAYRENSSSISFFWIKAIAYPRG